jgi:hypothetical protein
LACLFVGYPADQLDCLRYRIGHAPIRGALGRVRGRCESQ